MGGWVSPTEEQMRRLVVLVGVAILAATLMSSPSYAIWNQTSFLIGASGGGDPLSLIRLRNAGLDIITPDESTTVVFQQKIAARMDSLRLHYAGFAMKDIVYQESGPSA